MKKVVMTVVLALLSLGALFATPASASEAAEVAGLPIRDPLNRTESPLSYEGRWTSLSWAANAGRDTTTGYVPVNAYPSVSGAYFNPSTFSDSGAGDAAAITMQTAPNNPSRYVALWLNMPSPGSAQSGYQLIWEENSGLTSYTVELVKWTSGTSSVLASNAEVVIPAGTTLAISDNGSTVTAWKGSGGTLTSFLSASDGTYASGYAGVEAAGNISRSNNFQAGNLLGRSVSAVGVLDNLLRNELPLGTTNWGRPDWASEIGGAWNEGGYFGYGSNTTGDASAFWKPSTFSDSPRGEVVSTTIGSGSRWPGEWLSLLMNLPETQHHGPHSGYEARFAGVDGSNNYTVELAKWASGTRTVLATKSSVAAPPGTKIALTEIGGGLTIWAGSTSFSPVTAAYDSTYTSGYAGLEVNGVGGTENNFKAGGLALPGPGVPTVSSVSPASPANNNSPKVIGSAESGSTVKLYTNSTCSSSVAGSGTAAEFGSGGVAASVADNSTTTFYATATDAEGFHSACSTTSVSYTEDSTPPAVPTVSSVSPASPANNNSPKVIGSAEAGSTVKLYTNNTCTSAVAASGTAATFASPGIVASVSNNTTTTFYATASDAAGNASACSTTSVTYVEDSTAPAAPTVSSTNPASGSNNNEPKVIGSAESGSTVKLYTNSICISSVGATGTAAAFASPGLTVSVADNTTTTFYATATDAAGNVSSCSTTSVKYEEGTPKIYWGAWLGGNAYGAEYGDGPWDSKTWNLFEEHAGKKISIEHFGQPAPWNQAFAEGPLNLTRERGAIPLMDMDPDGVTLKEIVEGKKDSDFTSWAKAVANWGYPMMFRWTWEMNGTWFQWGKEAASNPTLYKEAWWHLHDLTEEQGATNLTWVWCPNLSFSGSTSLSSLYPGKESEGKGKYVDWTCLDGYNFGTNPAQPDSWKSFSTLYTTSYNELLSLAPTKPIMIGEMASTEYGGEKSAWITDAIGTQIPKNFPKIKAVVWYNKWDGGRDWPIETSASAQTAFKNAIAAPIYASNTFGSLSKLTKIEPLP